jgi:hypothetical protein
MNRCLLSFSLLLAVAASALAQANSVSVDVFLEQTQFLANEELKVAVRITNLSGQKLQLGADPDWLTFVVESREKPLIEKVGDPDVTGAFALESSLTATKRVDLAPYFRLSEPGRYKVTARVKIAQWNSTIFSQAKTFDILRGTQLKEIQFGVPPSEAAVGKPPEVRKYVLQQADYLNGMKLYVRITDLTGGRTYKLLPVAKMLSFSRPEAQLDRFSNIHVLHQVAQRSFSYCAMNPNGQIIARQTHDFADTSRPRMQMDKEGRIAVHGGMRRISETDLPPSDDSDPVTNTNVKQP